MNETNYVAETKDGPYVISYKTNWRKWTLMTIRMTQFPQTITEWLWFAWNFDIFIGWFPILKFFILLSYLASVLGRWL